MSDPLLNIPYSFPFRLYHSARCLLKSKIQSHGLETFLWSHGGCSRCEFCTAAADGAHSQRKGSEAPTLKNKLSLRSAFTAESRTFPLRRTLISACTDSAGALGLTAPQNCFTYGGDGRRNRKRPTCQKNKNNVHKRPQEVHLNARSRRLKVCLKTAGRLYFL